MSEYETVRKDGKAKQVHVAIMEEMLGRPLKENEVVHHIDGDKRNNSPENLQLMDRAEHSRLHHTGLAPSPGTLKKMRKARAGRPASGRKFSKQQAIEIAEKLEAGEKVKDLAREYGSSVSAITSIRDGKSYRDVLERYPDSAFPLAPKQKRAVGADSRKRKYSDDEINAIRLAVMSGEESMRSIARRFGTSHSTIQKIVNGESYRHVPWPEKIVRMRRVKDVASLLKIFLSEPMSSIRDEYTALKEDYRLEPDLYAVTLLRLVRRALSGDSELAVLLMALGGYKEELDRIISENSVILQALQESSAE